MPAAQARTLAENYSENNYALINAQREKPDSNEYLFPLDVLEQYISYVKENAVNLGIEQIGIKIKMGQYPEREVIDPRQNEKYKGYQVAYLTPFSTDTAGRQSDVTEIDSLDYSMIVPPRS